MITDGGFETSSILRDSSMSQGDPILPTFFVVATFGKHKVPDILCLPGI